MNKTAAFIMPVKLGGKKMELRHLGITIESIKCQTDSDWILIMVDDYSDNQAVYDAIDEIKADLKDKVHVIYSDKNYGTGAARNKGIAYANEMGAPFILFNDADDVSDPRRLELTRKAFEDETVNVVYSSFDVIDENGNIVPDSEINMAIREIIEGHKIDIVEGENAFVNIATKKKYTNLTSCTSVRTSLAVEEPFPSLSVSEDCYTWFRYGAHPGKFVFLNEIKGRYRIHTGVASRSRSLNKNFYEKLFEVDTSGFEAAVKLAKKFGTMGGWDEDELRTAFHVRLALNLLHGNAEKYCQKSLEMAMRISREKTMEYIDLLPCQPAEKARIKELANSLN